MKTITREGILRMVGSGNGNGNVGGGSVSSLTGYATQQWAEDNYISKAFFAQLFELRAKKTVIVTDSGGEVIGGPTTTVEVLPANELIPETVTETDESTGNKTTTSYIFEGIRTKLGFWSESFISALGQSSGGSGGGASTLSDLIDVTLNNLKDGQVLTYISPNDQYPNGMWVNSSIQQGGGTVSNITTGTGLSGGPITTTGTISIAQTYLDYISQGHTAYEWGNHANAGYLTSSSISDMATQTWVGNQGFLTGITPSMITNALGFTPLSNTTTFWGRTISNNSVTGIIKYAPAIELEGMTSSAGNGGYIDFHYNNDSSDYTSRIIESASGMLRINQILCVTNGGNVGIGITPNDSYRLTIEGSQYINGSLHLSNGKSINFLSNGGDNAYWNVLTMNSQNQLAVGYYTRTHNQVLSMQGGLIDVYTNGGVGSASNPSDNPVHAMRIEDSGQVRVIQGALGLRIGDGLITWDSNNHALRITDKDGNVANLYATGGVSSLGFYATENTRANVSTLNVSSAINIGEFSAYIDGDKLCIESEENDIVIKPYGSDPITFGENGDITATTIRASNSLSASALNIRDSATFGGLTKNPIIYIWYSGIRYTININQAITSGILTT